jgi:small subunit ribosomal protein S17
MPRRILEGNVVSAKTDKTVTVRVERRYMHPMYKKYIMSSSKYTAHDETNSVKEGDKVSIIECRPLSKTKRWMVLSDADANASVIEKPVVAKKEEKVDAKVAPKKVPAKKAPAKKAAAKKTKSTKKDA